MNKVKNKMSISEYISERLSDPYEFSHHPKDNYKGVEYRWDIHSEPPIPDYVVCYYYHENKWKYFKTQKELELFIDSLIRNEKIKTILD